MLLRSWFEGASRNEEERATTSRPRTAVSAEAISSVIPPAKKPWLGSPELFSSGSTAMVGGRTAGACAVATESVPQSASVAAPAMLQYRSVRPARNLFMRALSGGGAKHNMKNGLRGGRRQPAWLAGSADRQHLGGAQQGSTSGYCLRQIVPFDHWMRLSGRITPSMFQGAPTLSVALLDNRPCATSPLSFFMSKR